MRSMVRGLIIFLALGSPVAAVGLHPESSEDGIPPSFAYQGARAVPVDIDTVDISYEFDTQAREARARAVVRFRALEPGHPFLDLVPDPTALELDGQSIPAASLRTVADPDSVTRLRVLDQAIGDTSAHVLTVSYKLASDDVSFGSGTARSMFHMSDLARGGRMYFEQYGPANLEFDAVTYTFHVRVTGSTKPHEIFANGRVTPENDGWRIEFPSYFTASSLYFHLADTGRFQVSKAEVAGRQRAIPVTVYSSSQELVREALVQARAVIAENEETYGPLAHDHLVIYVTTGGGGMEYCGATTTSMDALGHELTHSWFARGVMPADGNAGWIDEAVASWRDDEYPRASTGPSGSALNLGGFPPFRRHTTTEAYSRGARLISQLDFLFQDSGGMKPLLRQLFATRQRTPITVQYFQQFLQTATGRDLTEIFQKYVYGKVLVAGVPMVTRERFPDLSRTRHPRPYTVEERARFR